MRLLFQSTIYYQILMRFIIFQLFIYTNLLYLHQFIQCNCQFRLIKLHISGKYIPHIFIHEFTFIYSIGWISIFFLNKASLNYFIRTFFVLRTWYISCQQLNLSHNYYICTWYISRIVVNSYRAFHGNIKTGYLSTETNVSYLVHITKSFLSTFQIELFSNHSDKTFCLKANLHTEHFPCTRV